MLRTGPVSRRKKLNGWARAPGACGELAQGLADGRQFLVTCPIDMYSEARVQLEAGTGRVAGPEESPKACRAVELTLEHFLQSGLDAELRLASPLPRGKGMASSTADVAAAIVATAMALGREVTPEETAQIAVRVEPSDGIMLPQVALFDHVRGELAQILGEPPPLRVLILDFGGRVDTLAFNDMDREEVLVRQEQRLQESLSCIIAGIQQGDAGAIGRGATISSLANQEILYKPQLEAVIDLAQAAGAAGVNVAHSGTVIGMLFPDTGEAPENMVSLVHENLPGLERTYLRRVVNGGVITRLHPAAVRARVPGDRLH